MTSGPIGQHARPKIYLLCVVASSAGRNAYFVLSAWIAVDVSHGTSALAVLLALGSAAELLTSNIGGTLVDRFDRRMLCIGCDAFRLLLMLATTFGFLFADALTVLYVSWTIFAIVDRTYSTSLQAMIPSIVCTENLGSFNSSAQIGMQAGNLMAAAVTGLMLTAAGRDLTSLLPSAFFVLSLLALLAMRSMQQLSSSAHRPVNNGVRRSDLLPTTFALGSLKTSAAIYALIYAMGMLVSVLGSGFVIHELEGTPLQFGYLEAGWALGSVAGCAVFLLGSRFWRRQSVLAHLVLAGILLLGFWFYRSFLLALIQMTILGLSYNVARVLIEVRVQAAVPIDALGRVRSQIHTVCVAIGLLAYTIIGGFGNAVLPSEIFGLFGAVMIAAALYVCFRINRGGSVESRIV
ncbi:MFS transporter [Rhizobium redzepovicii]|uniref:MFS transporter n=1 Tax=Rhizobium redzepovicii TaxID=2867518 RepID=A0AAW8PCB8_9HYPH|nr:MFS transporter [Rhizobium redzepovicii]MDR9764185.1 MFS transporter [Rhizobium redzepovicii]MDR9781101.1 MFS transporter [Rhizobium redzepovicii]